MLKKQIALINSNIYFGHGYQLFILPMFIKAARPFVYQYSFLNGAI